MTLLLDITVTGDPVPKQRPRLGKGANVYTPRETQAAEQAIAMLACAQLRSREPITDTVIVELEFHVATERRRDIDNLAKTVLDALNGICWKDDDQVIELRASKTVDPANPRTVIRVRQADAQHLEAA